MARVGWFDPELDSKSWFDSELNKEAWFDSELIELVSGSNSQSLAITLDDVTASVTQSLRHTQSVSVTLDSVTSSITQNRQKSQSLAITLDGITVGISQNVSAGSATLTQSLGITLDGVSVSSNQLLRHTQSTAVILDGITASFNQSAASANKSQSLNITLDDIVIDSSQSNSHVSNDITPIHGWIRNRPTKDEEEAERIKLGIIEAKKEIKQVVKLIKQVEVKQEHTQSSVEAAKLAIHKQLLAERIKRANDEYQTLLHRINTNYLRARLETHKAIKRQQAEESDIAFIMSMLANM